MPRQAEQLLVDPRREQGAYRPRLHRRKVQALGQRRDRPPAIGIGRMPQIIDDQRELRVARARVDQPVDQGGEALPASSPPPSSSTSRPTRSSVRDLLCVSSNRRRRPTPSPWLTHVSRGSIPPILDDPL